MKDENLKLRLELKQFKDELCEKFYQKKSIIPLTRKLLAYIDNLVISLFNKHELNQGNQFCLLALGSYGRRELQLHSDVDLLLLHTEDVNKKQLVAAQNFIQDCWDIGLDISHQMTTVSACAELAKQDLSVISSILDMYLLCGRGTLMEELEYQTNPLNMWPSDEFFFAKQAEQAKRYTKYRETAFNLEPNVKYGPGSMRDLQLLLSIGKRHFGIKKLAEGITCGFITDKEYEELINCQHFLWRVRFALHAMAGKQEERLLFDYQKKLAAIFGFTDNPNSLAIEQFMKAYFKVIKRNRELNEMLLQWFAEAIVHREKQQIVPLDHYFQLSNNFIEVKHSRVFKQNPTTLLQLFYWIAKRPNISGVRASTIRLLREHLYLMNKTFLNSTAATQCFLAIFKEGNDPFQAMHHMNRYGVLGHYLDCFAAVTGQMQYDLFHVYTVDQHTLFVIRNLVRFLDIDYQKQFPLAALLMPKLEKREILYLAALFHDIAKGRGGDHSELGAIEAQEFASRHHLSQEDTDLLCWLVKNHLLMSQTAQRKDIYDPKTIQVFCNTLPQAHYLDYLYLLTVADICATNQTLWNSWKDSLLKELYKAAHQSMAHQQTLLDETQLIKSRQLQAMQMLEKQGVKVADITRLWQTIEGLYFLHESPEMIARHTRAILECNEYPLVLIMPHHSQGGTEVFIYMPHRNKRFSIATAVLSNQQVTIQEAMILTCDNAFDLDIYIVLDEQHQAFFDEHRTDAIRNALIKHLSEHKKLPPIVKRRITRTMAHFSFTPKITFDEEHPHTRLFLVTSDRPGLLAHLSRIFSSQNIVLHNAKIATAGERVEDMFYLSTAAGMPLNKDEIQKLEKQLLSELS